MNSRKMVVMVTLALAFAGATVLGAADPAAAHVCDNGNTCDMSSCPNDGKIHKHHVGGCTSVPTLMIV